MLAIVTHVQLKPGSEGEWDRAMHDRLRAAEGRPGWVAGQLSVRPPLGSSRWWKSAASPRERSEEARGAIGRQARVEGAVEQFGGGDAAPQGTERHAAV